MGTTINFGWEFPDVDADADAWGDIQNELFQDIDTQVKSVKDTADAAADRSAVNAFISSLVGLEARFYLSTPPAGWVAANGGTIGNAASGATNRANADTVQLFVALWGTLDSTLFPIQDSTGAPTTRGVTATADYAANKRLPLPDARGEFPRGWDNGRGVDTGRAIGSSQSDALQGFHVSLPGLRQVGTGASFAGSGAGDNPGAINESGGPVTDGVNGTPRIAAETRPRNIAALVCIKL
jgi:phage-related tail fiber protein